MLTSLVVLLSFFPSLYIWQVCLKLALILQCSIDVLVSVQESLLTQIQLSEGNLLRVTVEALYSAPEAFIFTGPQYNYMVGFQVPAVGEVSCWNPTFFYPFFLHVFFSFAFQSGKCCFSFSAPPKYKTCCRSQGKHIERHQRLNWSFHSLSSETHLNL